jgi:ATP-dependent DNA ligase
MLALLVSEVPKGRDWIYEPKWDGFRCLAFRDGESIELQSKSCQSLTRYFPEVVAAVSSLASRQLVLDGEIVVPVDGALSFDDLLQRIHPADSRVRALAGKTPALYIVFDLLAEGRARIADLPLRERRARLERLAKSQFGGGRSLRLSPSTTRRPTALGWLRSAGGPIDGVIAKRRDLPYRSGDRTGMQKVKFLRTADCVVGGFRYASRGKTVGSLLLGLYDEAGKLNHVGFCSGLKTQERDRLASTLPRLVRPPGFTGRAPGGPSRWSTERTGEWQPLAPRLVVEVQYDHFSQDRFRHGTKFLRWRPDKAARECSIRQVARESRVSPLALLDTGRA